MPKKASAPARTVTALGRTQTIKEWATEMGMAGASIYNRIARGWTEAEACTTPPGEQPERITAMVKPGGKRSKAPAPTAPAKTKRRSPRPSVDLEAVNDEINAAFGSTAASREEVRPDVELLLELVGIDHQVLARTARGTTLFVPAAG